MPAGSVRARGLTVDRLATDIPAYLETLQTYVTGPLATHGYTMSDTSSYQEAGTHRHFTDLEALYARTMA